MKMLKVTNDALNYYRESVKGNKYITEEQARARNLKLVQSTGACTKKWLFSKVYMYHDLHITVRNGKVIKIINHKRPRFSKKRYIELSKALGIKDIKYYRKHCTAR
ncbi:hypothetical protein P9D47_14030 [Bacillus haynesii]|uniref:hypothetical protein n=1 Tax=Bacillus haynesii TaxID=1925021 RepID=UPI0015931A17|nr:hypothetical protein [Bacillus haynesii]NVB33312.1 hypothetical protein [Bacillus licheniformis]MCY7779554.1 hypothetical protein [Bacillus haynesii]MCY8672518.1 hypothetical protein [Bacillus haynesii]MEC0671588.1 hypothetical protein [Bacillus haynesii]MEC1419579.1 hypothetical protein [Bacillus haynesii]